MSDLEFQRELTPEQIREALSLLDGKAGTETRSLQAGSTRPAEGVGPCAGQTSTTAAIRDWLTATEDPQQRKKHLTLAVAFYGLGITATAAVTLLSWSERALTPPPVPSVVHEQLTDQPEAKPVNSASPSPTVANPIQANRGDDQPASGDVAISANAVPFAMRTAPVPVTGTSQTWRDERASRRTREVWWHARAVRVAAANGRFWRRHWRPRAECFPDACAFWPKQRVFYEPPRNVTQ